VGLKNTNYAQLTKPKTMSFGFVLENIIFKVVLFEQKNLFMSKHHSIFAQTTPL